jgi:hypothetical protein
MATGYAVVGDDYVRRSLPPGLPELTFTVGEEVRADPFTASGTRVHFVSWDRDTHELIVEYVPWSQDETPYFGVGLTELDACRGMVRAQPYGPIIIRPGRRLVTLDFDNPGDLVAPQSTAWGWLPLNRADVTGEISAEDALAVVLASL